MEDLGDKKAREIARVKWNTLDSEAKSKYSTYITGIKNDPVMDAQISPPYRYVRPTCLSISFVVDTK